MQNTSYTQSYLLEPLSLDGHETVIYASQPENLKLTISDRDNIIGDIGDTCDPEVKK